MASHKYDAGKCEITIDGVKLEVKPPETFDITIGESTEEQRAQRILPDVTFTITMQPITADDIVSAMLNIWRPIRRYQAMYGKGPGCHCNACERKFSPAALADGMCLGCLQARERATLES